MKPKPGGYRAFINKSRRGFLTLNFFVIATLALSILFERPVQARRTDSLLQDSLSPGQTNDFLENDLLDDGSLGREGTFSDAPVLPPEKPGEDTQDIEIEILEEIDPDSVGILEDHQGGLGEFMWSGTSRARAHALMHLVPSTSTSSVVRDLTRRILLSNATAPEGDMDDESLVAQRINLLYTMGDIEAMRILMDIAPKDILNSDQNQAHIDGLLLAGDHVNACRALEQGRHSYQEIYWRQLRVFCDLLSQKHDKAQLGLNLLRDTPSPERQSPAHNEFQALAEYILEHAESDTENGLGKDPPTLLEPTPLSLALARIGRIETPPALMKTSDPALLLAMASNPQFSLMERIEAAEKAEQLRLFATQNLKKLYESVAFPQDIIARISENGDQETPLPIEDFGDNLQKDPTKIRALLWQAAAQPAAQPETRARLLDTLYQQARQDGVYAPIARVSAPLLLALVPESHLMWFAAEAVRALLTANKIDAALSWYDMVEQYAYSNPTAATIRQEIWPLVQIADSEDRLAWSDYILESWIMNHHATGQINTAETLSELDSSLESLTSGYDQENSRSLSLILALLLGLGEPVTGDHWAFAWKVISSLPSDTVTNDTASRAALINALRESAQSLRVAETVFLALACLGNQSPSHVDPLILQEVVHALRHIGLDEEARSLALEAALEQGI